MNARAERTEPSNGGAVDIEHSMPYRAQVELTGTSDLMWHRWNADAVNEKAKAAKNSKAKKSDNLETYVWRNENDELCMPGEYVRQAAIHAAKFRQDPRSPRKSAMDLYRAGIVSLTNLGSLGDLTWDYEDTRRVVIQRAGVNRTRPCTKQGWSASFVFLVLTPEYISPMDLHSVLTQAGVLVGLADFRPTFGRFAVTRFEVLGEAVIE
jgi:hypothetical protein